MMDDREHDRDQRVDHLFLECLNLSPEARSTRLSEACGGDTTLRREVEELLQADERAETKFSGLLPSHAAELVRASVNPAADIRTGQQVGPFRLQKRLARGGFGTVYLAERSKPYHEQVAVKLLHADKLESPELVQRVLREMQVLSELRHPNIVNQLMAGLTDSGEPFIAMEFVDGLPLDRFCDENRLSIRARLELVQRVCDAVRFAHEHGWLHRDLKPGNILVTKDGAPKLLDFGIAKFVQYEQDENQDCLTIAPLGTPQYMSPEQIRGAEVDESSDVYSLGVMLYEVLTGVRVMSMLLRNSSSPGWEEMRRCICEVVPPRPSLAVSGEPDASAALIAANRSTRPRKTQTDPWQRPG